MMQLLVPTLNRVSRIAYCVLRERSWARRTIPNTQYPIRVKPHSGFTLIELLVTIGIMALIVGGALVSFRTANQQTQLRQGAEDLRQALMSVRTLALAPETTKTPGSPGYQFQMTGERGYVVWELVAAADGVPRQVRTGSLPATVAYQAPTSLPAIDFLIDDSGRARTAGTTPPALHLGLVHVKSGQVATVTLVTATGQVEVVMP